MSSPAEAAARAELQNWRMVVISVKGSIEIRHQSYCLEVTSAGIIALFVKELNVGLFILKHNLFYLLLKTNFVATSNQAAKT